MSSVTATGKEWTTTNYGVDNAGLYSASVSPTMINVIAAASGGTYSYGVYDESSHPAMTNTTATASAGGVVTLSAIIS